MQLKLILLLVLIPGFMFGQTEISPEQRSTVGDEINKESSSFVPEPDSIDPLPLKKESLKDDDEPILEDIQQALKREKEKALKAEADKNNPPAATKSKTTKKKARKKTQAPPPTTPADNFGSDASVTDFGDRNPDEPDYSLENQFNSLYKRYNAQPTSDETWSKASQQVPNVYVVQRRDTLFSISKILFGDSQFWPKIWAINNQGITNPHIIAPGLNVNFYPGTSTEAPSLTVGTPAESAESMPLTNIKNKVDEFGEKVRDYTKQNTEFDRLVKEGSGRGQVGMLPSLPELRGGKFYYKTQTSIELTPIEFVPDGEPSNPYILTSTDLVSDYVVKAERADDLVCKSGQYVPAATELNLTTVPGEYNLLVKENDKLSLLKATHVYQNVGRVTIDADGSMRINQCLQNVNTDALIVSDAKLAAVLPTVEALPNADMQIIDGLALRNQQLYYSKHFVIINANASNVQEGQTFDIYSKTVGKNVGQVKILKNTGTLSLGYITETNEVIRAGDTIVTQ